MNGELPEAEDPSVPAQADIRTERPEDASAIDDLTERAFDGQPFSAGTEPAIVRALRASGNLALSLVAERSGTIVGHVTFSPVDISGSDGEWFGLGPISVSPDLQRRGIGRQLVNRGLWELRAAGATGCALIGNPAIYSKYGFESGGLSYRGVDNSIVQYVVFRGPAPNGVLTFDRSFDVA